MKKRVISLVLALVLAAAVAAPALASAGDECPFTDVPADAWYREEVIAAYRTGLFEGTTKTTFSPDDTLTVAESVTLASRVHQYTHTGAVTLESAGGTEWYVPFFDYAAENGIIPKKSDMPGTTGLDEYLKDLIEKLYGDSLGGDFDLTYGNSSVFPYRPEDANRAATRAEMTEILYKAMEPESYTVINRVDEYAIPDVKQGSDSAPEVYAFYRAGILTGDEIHRFNADTTILRCEAAAILARMLDPSRRKSVTLITTAPPMPAYDAPVTEENILAVLDNMDPDGAIIMRRSLDRGGMPLSWYAPGDTVTDDLGTAVHEECHGITDDGLELDISTGKGVLISRFYTGGGQSVRVRHTDVFDSAELDQVIPDRLKRTSRYDMYVSPSADPLMASRQYGVYGLMNEYTAYCWGNNDSLLTYDYRVSHGYRWANDEYVAYAEFLYYILTYMIYARDEHPDVYNGIMANGDFLKAFSAVTAKFTQATEDTIAKYRASGRLAWQDDYDALMEQIRSPAYRQMLSLMTGK